MKRLYLSAREKKLGGVCGGLGEYLDADPTIIRLATIVVTIFTGFFPLLFGYIIAWMIIPRQPAT